MTDINNQPLDLSKLSKPIELKTESKRGFFSNISDFFKSKPEINILSTSPKPSVDDANHVAIKVDQDESKNHSQTTNSALAQDFFEKKPDKSQLVSETSNIPDKNDKIWFGPNSTANDTKPVSMLWLIGGAITIVIIIVMILGSFGLINLIKNSIIDKSLTNTQQMIKQSTSDLADGKIDSALENIGLALDADPNNKEALGVLAKINQQQANIIINEIDKYKELENVNKEYFPTTDSAGHYQISVSPTWKKIESGYDLKYATSHGVNLGIKKYPRVNSMSELEKNFLIGFTAKDYETMDVKKDKTYADSQASIYVIKVDNMYQYSILIQKYQFGYEISAWLPTKNYQSSISDIQNFLKSFSLTGNYTIVNYDQLENFGSEKIKLHSWPGNLSSDQKDQILTAYTNSINYINDHLKISYTNNIDIYLYPDFATLYQYTLSDNSFSHFQTKTIHLVYTNAENHQSFGYETAKIIYQSTFGEVTEPLVLEGISVWLDQTGRDYKTIVKNSQYVPLSDLLSVNWDLNHTDLKYHEAGIFTEYLINEYGVDLYTQLSKEKEFPEAYQKIYGKSLTLLESEFQKQL